MLSAGCLEAAHLLRWRLLRCLPFGSGWPCRRAPGGHGLEMLSLFLGFFFLNWKLQLLGDLHFAKKLFSLYYIYIRTHIHFYQADTWPNKISGEKKHVFETFRFFCIFFVRAFWSCGGRIDADWYVVLGLEASNMTRIDAHVAVPKDRSHMSVIKQADDVYVVFPKTFHIIDHLWKWSILTGAYFWNGWLNHQPVNYLTFIEILGSSSLHGFHSLVREVQTGGKNTQKQNTSKTSLPQWRVLLVVFCWLSLVSASFLPSWYQGPTAGTALGLYGFVMIYTY